MPTGLALALALLAAPPQTVLEIRPAEPDELRFGVEVQGKGDILRVRGTVTSRAKDRVRVGFGAATLRVRLYRAPERTGPEAWDSSATGVFHLLYLKEGLLDPGHPAIVGEPELVEELSGASMSSTLPAGTYYATVTISLEVPKMTSPEMAAGTLVVQRR